MSRYLPSLSNLISLDKLPSELGFLQDAVDTVFDDIYYDHYNIVSSKWGECKTFNLDIIIDKQLGIQIPGIDASLLLNPSKTDGTPNQSTFNVTLQYRLGILRFVNRFNLSQFSFGKEDFINLLLNIFGVDSATILEYVSININNPVGGTPSFIVYDEEDLVAFFNDYYALTGTTNELIYTDSTSFQDIETALASGAGITTANVIDDFGISTDYPGGVDTIEDVYSRLDVERDTGALSISDLIDTLNTDFALAGTANEIVYVADPETTYDDIINALNTAGKSILDLIVDYVVADNDTFEEFEQILIDFFVDCKSVNGDEYQNLFKPYVSFSINDLTLALSFPRSFLQPIDPLTNVPYTDQNIKSMLRFDVGAIKFSTDSGFKFDEQANFSFDKSEIANTGIMFSFTDAVLDLSSTSNIPEASAAGYSDDFVGVFVASAEIDLPASWNHDTTNSTAVIKGTNLLIGTGGFSGTLALAARTDITTAPLTPIIKANFGGFAVELDTFSITFLQNAVTASTISGSITMPASVTQKDGTGKDVPVVVKITISFDSKGNFEITAYDKVGFVIDLDNVFTFTMKELSIGESNDHYYIETAGTLKFTDDTISSILSGNIEIQKLRIWDDGKIELVGGTIPLPTGTQIDLGPAKIFITAIHYGSTQKMLGGVMRKYNYFGFDGGVNINPGGVDARGTGIKYCYTVDSGTFDSYISIDSFSVSIIIPGDADPEDATVLINGWLSVSQEPLALDNSSTPVETKVYAGGIDIILPQVKLAASADMKYAPDVPAWIVDLGLELPSPIPLGPTGLGIYGFRGLVGQRYVASKEAVPSLTEASSWYDYYKAPPKEGVAVQKFETPFLTAGDEIPFSVGAGVSLATSADGGRAFSCKLFLLLSLPDVIIFEGKANMLSERVGLTSQDPPFFAYLAITSESVETGFGLSYKLPQDTGDILNFYVQMQAAFFFNNPKAWYINFGTDTAPIKGQILSFLTGQVYLMLSAQGIKMGASAEFDFNKKYLDGTLSAAVQAYIKTDGEISFHRPQIGAHASTGGSVNVQIFRFGFFISFNSTLGVEAPEPFLIDGSVSLEVGFKILWKKISKKFTVEFRWEKTQTEPQDAIIPFDITLNPVKAINIMSNEQFDVISLGSAMINSIDPSTIDNIIIPMDSYIDIEFTKPLYPNKVTNKIGGVGTVNEGYMESIPPQKINYQSNHQYSIEDITVYYYDKNKPATAPDYDKTGKWTEYFPYQAMLTPDAIPADTSQLTQLGQWQIHAEGVYNRIRLLAQSPFSYMDPGLKGWCDPQKFGITPSSLFCVGLTPEAQEADWSDFTSASVVTAGTLISKKDSAKTVRYKMLAGNAIVEHLDNIYNISESLFISNDSTLRIQFVESCAFVRLKLFTFSQKVVISYYYVDTTSGVPTLTLIKSDTKSRYDLLTPIVYNNSQLPVDYISISPSQADSGIIKNAETQIDTLTTTLYEGNGENESAIAMQIAVWKQTIADETANGYAGYTFDSAIIRQMIALLTQSLANLTLARDLALSNAARLNELHDVAKAKMDSCCSIMMSPPQSSERLSCINSLGDIVPAGVSLDEVEMDYDTYIASLQVLSNGMAACRMSYATNVANLCNDAHTYLYDTQARADAHIKEADDLQTQINTVLENINYLNSLMATPPTAPPPNVDPNSTVVHEIEWMSTKDYQLSQDQPGIDAVQKSYQNSVAAIQGSLAPVWRPDTEYVLSITVADTLHNGAQSPQTFMFGFKTARPVGYFQEDYDAVAPVKYAPTDNLNLYKLTTLRNYIDYERSYPNADGNIINAKPLYYKDTELNLFYAKSYVYHLFGNWPKNNAITLPALTGYLEVVVKDPIEEIDIPNPLPPTVVSKLIPSTVVNWNKDDNAPAPKSISVWDIMRNPRAYDPSFVIPDGGYCWQDGGNRIVPAWISTTVTFNFLNPSKLYTAIFNNVYGLETNINPDKREVHRYVFQTSRYANLADQIGSYLMEDENMIQKAAVYNLPLDITPTMLTQITNLLAGTKTGDSYLDSTYINPFDCFIEGVLKLSPLAPAMNTEINVVVNTETGDTIGLLIRNPEPFINPKLPDVEKAQFCTILKMDSKIAQPQGTNPSLFSKDCSQFFITAVSGLTLTTAQIRLQFNSVKWDDATQKYISDVNNQYTTDAITIKNI